VTPELTNLLDAWLAWSRGPADRQGVLRLQAASRVAGLGVPAYAVGDLIVDGLRRGLSADEAVAALGAS
jgi:hypothetical protein